MIDDLSRQMSDHLAIAREERVASYLGLQFRQNVNVRLRKPRLMPTRLYRLLMRTIVVESGPIIFGTPRLNGLLDSTPPRLDWYWFK